MPTNPFKINPPNPIIHQVWARGVIQGFYDKSATMLMERELDEAKPVWLALVSACDVELTSRKLVAITAGLTIAEPCEVILLVDRPGEANRVAVFMSPRSDKPEMHNILNTTKKVCTGDLYRLDSYFFQESGKIHCVAPGYRSSL